jgi:hypothetical protein
VFISLSSSDPSKATISPANILILQGLTTLARAPVLTGIGLGSAAISASAYNMTGDTETVLVTTGTGSFSFSPSSLTITGIGTTQILALSLPVPAPAGGVTATLSLTNTAVATVPLAVTFAAGASSAVVPVTGVGTGATVIHASAPPAYSDTTAIVNVTTSGTIVLPANVTCPLGQPVAFPVTLSTPAPTGGVTVTLASSANATAAIFPASVFIAAGATTPATQPQLTGFAVGTANIVATATGYSTATQPVTVTTATATVTWYGACWYNGAVNGVTGSFQAIDFALATSAPVTVQGSLFFTANCDASQGADNMNDFGSLTGSTHMIQGFAFHPGVIPSSAMYWVGPRTANGLCSPGSPCSGCLNYTAATPDCGNMP